MYLPLPMFILRRIVRKNPWLLADNGFTSQSRVLSLGLFDIEIDAKASLDPKQKARLQAEADAGKLFKAA